MTLLSAAWTTGEPLAPRWNSVWIADCVACDWGATVAPG